MYASPRLCVGATEREAPRNQSWRASKCLWFFTGKGETGGGGLHKKRRATNLLGLWLPSSALEGSKAAVAGRVHKSPRGMVQRTRWDAQTLPLSR